MAVKTISLNLTNAIDSATPVAVDGCPANKPIGAITVTKVPAGATFRLHLGKQDGFYIDGPGVIEGLTQEEDNNQGLFYSNDSVAQPGVLVEITVGFVGHGS